MASYPNSIYVPKIKENKNGVIYDEDKTTVAFAEDFNDPNAEIVALETFLRIPTSIPDSPVAGSAYFDTATFILYIYTGTTWKSIQLS